MNHFETVRELTALTFCVSPDQIAPETVQSEIPEWDSLGHLNLMVAIEDAFNITLEIEDMTRLTSVPAILDYLKTTCTSH